MSRLEEIKKRYSSAAIVVFEGLGTVSADIQDINWLIEQAKRAEKLQDQIDNKILPEIEKGWTENIRYREALEFYAERDNYQWEVSYRPQQEIDCMVIDDSGHTARKALDGGNND